MGPAADNTNPSKRTQKSNYLLSGWLVLAGALLGVYIGLNQPSWAAVVAPFGQLYLDILKMCVLPILITAISMSIARLIKFKNNTHYIRRMALVFALGLAVTSIIGILSGIFTQPGADMPDKALKVLGAAVHLSGGPELEVYLTTPYVPPEDVLLIKQFLINLIPDNIFSALSDGSSLKVLFFAILFGFGVGSISDRPYENIRIFFDAIYSVFAKLMIWLMYLLPLGLCGLIASNLSQVGLDILSSMLKFVVVVIMTFILLFIISSIILGWRVGSFWTPFPALKKTVILALGTANSLATLPSALDDMHQNLGYDKQSVNLVVPLAISLCRFGSVVYFALATLFIAQIYSFDLGIEELFIIFLGSILAGVSTAGMSGVVTLTMLGVVLTLLKLPFDAVLVLLIVIDPIVAPFRVLAIVHTACAATAVVIPYRPSSSG